VTFVMPVLIVAFESSVNVASLELQSPQGNRILSSTRSWTLALGHRQYGQLSLTTAELLVWTTNTPSDRLIFIYLYLCACSYALLWLNGA